MSRPALPVITLVHGPWRAEVYDPRPDPLALGARYCHGGYVRALIRDGRQLTGRLTDAWSRFDGEGLPETFENSLGWGPAGTNEEYLRIGAGRLRRQFNNPREWTSLPALCTVLEWAVTAQGPDHLSMTTADSIGAMGQTYGYRLERHLRLHDDGLDSTTRLTLQAEQWQGHLISWYAHPFFAQRAVSETALGLPAAAHVTGPLAQGADGLWRVTENQGRGVISGLWGERGPLTLHLSPALGGGRLAIGLDRPLDHAIAFAADPACSLEPKLVHHLVHGETVDWTISYRWLA